MVMKRKVLFGGIDLKWSSGDWTASDDRVRGGKSQSHLTPLAASDYTTARFHGHLDIQTLGGAGFASQRTTASWDLSSFDGIDLVLEDGDEKAYTFILKDEIAQELPYVGECGGTGREGEGTREREREREQATVSWECDFKVPESTDSAPEGFGEEEQQEEENRREKNKGKEKGNGKVVSIPWKSFKPTYRGKEKKDAKPIDLASIRRMSLMMRSFFGTQEGDFELTLKSIEAVTMGEGEEDGEGAESGGGGDVGSDSGSGRSTLNKASTSTRREGTEESQRHQRPQEGWMYWLLGRCWKL